MSRILVIPDMHMPYGHVDTVPFLVAIKKKYKPDRVVCLGDEVDQHDMSFHDSDPDLMSGGDELEFAIERMQPIYKLFPEMDLLDSNHGSMAYRKALSAKISRKYIKAYQEVLRAPKGWKWHNALFIREAGRRMGFFHGITKDVMKVVKQRGHCVAQGHFHTEYGVRYCGNPDGTLWGLSGGCLIDPTSLAFAYNKLQLDRPLLGASMIENGEPFLIPMEQEDDRWNGVI